MLLALQQRRTDDAWRSFHSLSLRGSLPSSRCLSRLVSQLCYHGSPSSLSRAQKVLARLQNARRTSLLDCNSLGLLAMATARAGAARYASTILRSMLELGYSPHVKAWSAVVSRLGKHSEDVPLALVIFEDICSRFRNAETEPPDCEDCDESARDVHAQSTSMRPDTGAFNAILNACAIAGNLDKAEELFQHMYSFGLKPDALSFNIMIKLYANEERREKLGRILDQMEHAAVEPCISTFHSLVAAYVGLGELEKAERIVRTLREGTGDVRSILRSEDEEVYAEENFNSAIESIQEEVDSKSVQPVSSGDVKLDCTPTNRDTRYQRRYKPDARMYTILMKGYMQKGRLKDVMQLLIAMQQDEDPESHPNEVTYTTAITACVRLSLLEEARAILSEMVAQKVPANVVTYNVLLNGYCKASQLEKAKDLMEDMKKAGVSPDVVSYNTLVDGCVSSDDNVSALALFREMREAGIAPSKVSYTTLMKAFGRNGQPHLAAKVFEEMKQDPRIRPDLIAWNILIESYSIAGLVEGAKKNFEAMKEYGERPTVATYGSLVKGFAKAGKPGEALVLWNEIQERLDERKEDGDVLLQPDAGLLDALVDICVRAGFFQKAMEVVSCMEKHRIPADKIKYKRMFVELHSKLYTSRHASQARKDRSADRRRAVEAFKFWVGLPNKYYETDWSP